MGFIKYQHLERLGTTEVAGIEQGTCYIFPKIDGTNAQVWFDERVRAGSRTRELSIESDNADFFNWVVQQENLKKFFEECPNVRLIGEWLVPHTLQTYKKDAWRKFYVFDVIEDDKYIPYCEYVETLKKYNIDYVPVLAIMENPSYGGILAKTDDNTFLIENGQGVGEGIVVKNYDFKNQFGRTTWAKVVTSEFRAKHSPNKAVTGADLVEEKIVQEFVTEALVEKEYAKILTEGVIGNAVISRLLGTVYYSLVKEESWNFVKKFKNPTVDFKKLSYFCNEQVKKVKPNLFGRQKSPVE